jgi:predicted RNA-binding Zn-ribbon protein involved in translation (DUF1610 family)
MVMSQASGFLYQEVTLDDLCPDCGNILIRGMWDDKKQRLVDGCSECGKIVEYTVDVLKDTEEE